MSQKTRTQKSVGALFDFLKKIIDNPDPYIKNDKLISALRSQGSLAKLDLPEQQIFATSLNTIKRNADYSIPGGFQALDARRLTALELICAASTLARKPKKRSKSELEAKNKILQQALMQARSDIRTLAAALRDAIRYGQQYAKDSEKPSIQLTCEKQTAELLHRFSLTKQSIATTAGANDEA